MGEQFIKTDLDLLAIPGLSSRLRELYGRLRFYAGKDGRCFPTHATLAGEIGLKDPKWIARLLARLRELKLIEWARNGPYSNEYRVLPPDVTWIANFLKQQRPMREVADQTPLRHKRGGRLTPSEVADQTPREVADQTPIKEVLVKEVFKRRTPLPPNTPPNAKQPTLPGLCPSDDGRGENSLVKIPRSGADRAGWFDAWWAIYWRRVARKPAEKAFRAHVKTEERFQQVMRATQTQTPAMEAREPDKRPHGATWLNGERWTDEPSQPARKGPSKSPSVDELAQSIEAFRRTR